jgi:hypothetical protein
MTPTTEDIRRACDMLDLANAALIRFIEADGERHWHRATGLLQDACEALGYDFRPFPKAAPATAEALYQYRGEY